MGISLTFIVLKKKVLRQSLLKKIIINKAYRSIVMTDLNQRLLVDAVAVWLGACDKTIPLQGLEGWTGGRRAITWLEDFWGSRFGL